jgi:hypothetical protein
VALASAAECAPVGAPSRGVVVSAEAYAAASAARPTGPSAAAPTRPSLREWFPNVASTAASVSRTNREVSSR